MLLPALGQTLHDRAKVGVRSWMDNIIIISAAPLMPIIALEQQPRMTMAKFALFVPFVCCGTPRVLLLLYRIHALQSRLLCPCLQPLGSRAVGLDWIGLPRWFLVACRLMGMPNHISFGIGALELDSVFVSFSSPQ
jgi:hypothetical protein